MLALNGRACEGATMANTPRTSQAGGALLAGAILVGTITGIVLRQSSIGFLIGLGVGLVLLALVWWRSR